MSFFRPPSRVSWIALAMLLALAVFLSTLQARINGSGHPYATDVGEIQNALPRWGLLHPSGYPLYTATGSLFVTVLRWVGVQPAAGVSLFSALWGVVAIGLLVALAQELNVSAPAAVLGALAMALSTSVWVDASLAEVHTLTLAFSVATLLFAVRFGRSGRRRDLLLLALLFTQGIAHQRAVALLTPAVIVLIWHQVRSLWRACGSLIAVTLLAPLVYLYLPLRMWMGATWFFGTPDTWSGIRLMLRDNVFRWPGSMAEWLVRLDTTWRLLSDDMLWPLLIVGLAGLAVLGFTGKWRECLGMTLAWVAYIPLTLIIWEGRVSDAELAAKLPVLALMGLGLALTLERLRRRSRSLGVAAASALALTLTAWSWHVRPFVLSITADPSAEVVIAVAERIAPSPDGRPVTLAVLWGHDYWALTYAQAYQGRLAGLNLVDHNANFRSVVDDGDHLLTLDETFYVLPVSWWEERLGRLYLTSAVPGVVELSPTPPIRAADVPAETAFDLGNGLRVRWATLEWSDAPSQLLLTVYWEVVQPVTEDYSVAVHLVSRDPPQGGEDILAQADVLNPVGGWYPTSGWSPGEVVRDDYALAVPSGSSPVAVRIAMYRVEPGSGFVNTAWLSLPVP